LSRSQNADEDQKYKVHRNLQQLILYHRHGQDLQSLEKAGIMFYKLKQYYSDVEPLLQIRFHCPACENNCSIQTEENNSFRFVRYLYQNVLSPHHTYLKQSPLPEEKNVMLESPENDLKRWSQSEVYTFLLFSTRALKTEPLVRY